MNLIRLAQLLDDNDLYDLSDRMLKIAVKGVKRTTVGDEVATLTMNSRGGTNEHSFF